MNEAAKFVQNRKHSITENRIVNILWYIVECYMLIVKDNVRYSENDVKNQSTIAFEDYLKFRFIEDYLIKNKKLLKQKASTLEEINFLPETQKEYIDIGDLKLKPDKIDIYINKLGLKNVWKENDEDIYFAIECKRIKALSDTPQYIDDIVKFTNRSYVNLRLPFEGQLAFIEAPLINHIAIYESINEKLSERKTIITDALLSQYRINPNFNGTYISKHKRNTEKHEPFSIFHLLFDYSNIVTE